MTISIWRYSHLALAVSSFLLLTLASLTGIILAFKPLSEKIQQRRADNFDEIRLSETLPLLRKKYPGITELSVDANDFVLIKGTDNKGEKLLAYVYPSTGKILSKPKEPSEFFEWVTALHRSLFLHEAGRFFIGLTAFLLLLITISGTILILQRQRGLKRFFSDIVRENFAQYYHVVLGRLSLIPIFLIALSGTYLSLARFELIDTKRATMDVDFDAIKLKPVVKENDFEIFKKVMLSEVQSVDFPFSEDAVDYYTLKLNDREVTVNQVTGEILGEVKYPASVILTELSLDLHTGRTNAVWAILLAIASGNILFFIYSGFTITFKRRANRVKNSFTAAESEFVILVGSENGSTFRYANVIHAQLISSGKSAYVTELDNYTVFPKAKHLIVMTATYGLGNPPTNALKFEKNLQKYPQQNTVQFSVLGFGSHSYPDFCKFAFDVDNLLGQQKWAAPVLEIHTVNDKSPEEFSLWADNWSQYAGVGLSVSSELNVARQERPHILTVVDRTSISGPGEAFLIKLHPSTRIPFTSGDLLAIYPADDHRERLYSIGKIGNYVQLSVKLHESGLGSTYLYGLKSGDKIQARIDPNPHFHFPEKAKTVILISNGTGIAPFLGMIDKQEAGAECHLYCGFRDGKSFGLYKNVLEKSLENQKLKKLHIAYSRQGEKQYVKDLLARDAAFLAKTLAKGGTIMLCGSLAMQSNVVGLLEEICSEHLQKEVSYYQSRGQVLMDCY